MKRVLIIAYYWPPSAGSGVQRWLKFSKYLPTYGWQPVIYTPENPSFDVKDENLIKDVPSEAEVLKLPIWEPYLVHKSLLGNKKKEKSQTNAGIVEESKSSFKAKISNWIRGNLFIPDPKIYWVKPSVKYLKEYLKTNPVDVIISTGTPHSMHLIAKELKELLSIPWIADFRDPWSNLDMLKSYHITKYNFKKYLKLEQSVLKNADLCATTSEVWKDDFLKLGAKNAVCITNGFDESDFSFEAEPYKEFVISHFGLLNHLRNPTILWQALAELCAENELFGKDLKLHLGGSIAQENLKEIKSHRALKDKVVVFDYLSHQEVISEYLKSSVLLLLLFNSESGRGNIPGKLFEYLASKKPIIAFGSGEGDSAKIIEDSKSGFYSDYNETNISELKKVILELYKQKKNNKAHVDADIQEYTRKALTGKLVSFLESLSI